MNTFESLPEFSAAFAAAPSSFSDEVKEAASPLFNRGKTGFPTAVCREVLRNLKALGVMTPDASFPVGWAKGE